MKTNRIYFLVIAVVFLLFLGVTSASARPSLAPAGTSFTYQGELLYQGALANGSFDFQFSLHDASGGGAQVGSTITKSGVTVTEGRFTVQLDFGSGIFTGDARWLEIAVQTAGGSGYTTLTPRQELTPAPYAIHASSVDGLPEVQATQAALEATQTAVLLIQDALDTRITALETFASGQADLFAGGKGSTCIGAATFDTPVVCNIDLGQDTRTVVVTGVALDASEDIHTFLATYFPGDDDIDVVMYGPSDPAELAVTIRVNWIAEEL